MPEASIFAVADDGGVSGCLEPRQRQSLTTRIPVPVTQSRKKFIIQIWESNHLQYSITLRYIALNNALTQHGGWCFGRL